ncbi:MAG: FAD-dependent oxidoreductase [Chloroflexota bacterium]
MTQYGFFVDLSRCIGCNSCTVSCKQWHDIAPGPAKPMRVYQWESSTYPNVRLHMLPIMCYHCENPSCMDACENKAIYKEEKYGAVLVDRNKCQGNRKCWEACPYGTPQYEGDEPDRRMLKCNMCIDRLEQGLKPICVLSCSMRALEFAPMEELVRKYGNLRRLNAQPGYAPCRLTCPAEVNAEEYLRLLSEGKVKAALAVFREVTPFAGVLGRVCTHPCETECQRGKLEEPVAIRALKRLMADEELKKGRKKASPVKITKTDKVAIVGSGPAGLACAYDLVRQGYPVTVFEASAKAGGMMRYGIPEYRLPKNILDNEVNIVKELGVEIKTASPVKKVADLLSQGYQAVFIAAGAPVAMKLGVPGEDVSGIIPAIDFLKRVNSGEKVKLGRRVVVVGGGSVAVDAARTARRLGAKEVHLVCLETRDLTCADRMPAQDPEIAEAEEEGVIVHPCLGVGKVLTTDHQVKGLETLACTAVLDTTGKFAPQFAPEQPAPALEADNIIVAIGQRPDAASLPDVAKAPSGRVKVDELTLETNVKGVFAGGDVVTGPGNIIDAVAYGKQAAESIDRYLKGEDLKKERQPVARSAGIRGGVWSVRPPVIPVEERKGFAEVEVGLARKVAKEMASRCFKCGTTMPCVVFKPADPKRPVVAWDAVKALELWKERQPWNSEELPNIFEEVEEILEAPTDIVGRNKLVLHAKDSEELLYYTTDNE